MENRLSVLPILEVSSVGGATWTTKGIGGRCFNTKPEDGEVTKTVSRKKSKRSLGFAVHIQILMCAIGVSSWNCWDG